MENIKKVLTIAGSDCSGGAGIQTDLKTFAANFVYGMSAITAITVQNTTGVYDVENISPAIVKKQIEAVLDDVGADAIKIGMLSNVEIIKSVYDTLKSYNIKNIVLDPVMISTSGYDLIDDEAKGFLVENLIPLASIITPNLNETEAILSILEGKTCKKIDTLEKMIDAGKFLADKLKIDVLIKGGHLTKQASDVLVLKNGEYITIDGERINTKNTHGTGCTLSSAIASNLALGFDIKESVKRSKKFITDAIKNSLDIGEGCGPTNPMGELQKQNKCM